MKQVRVTGGSRWKDAILKRLGLSTMSNGPHVKVGILGGATYSGEEGTEVGESVAYVAIKNEFGHGRTPPRPFFRSTIEAKRNDWARDVGRFIKAGLTIDGALNSVGQNMTMDIVSTIKTGDFTPLAAMTIKRKTELGRKNPSAPLQDSMTMIKAISHEVTS